MKKKNEKTICMGVVVVYKFVYYYYYCTGFDKASASCVYEKKEKYNEKRMKSRGGKK